MALSLELNLILLAILVILSGFFSSVELAVFSIGKLKMRRLVAANRPNSKTLLDLKATPQKLLTTILIGNNLVNISAASIATALSLQFFKSDVGVGIAIATGVITLGILIFGEITPKSLALKHNEFIALYSAPIIKVFSVIFSPLIFVLDKITTVFVSFFGADKMENILTEEEVKTVVSLGAEEGAIQKEEKEMIHRIFRFNDIMVEDVMTSRSEIAGVESGTKISQIDAAILREHSRIPVYKEDLDEILGIFHARDFLGSKIKNKSNSAVDNFLRPALFVYGNKKIDKLLKEFQRKKSHMAIVVDEYGGTIGLVTIEDLLEEIVGEIVDETDVESLVKKVKPKEFLVEGHSSLERVNKALGVSLKSEEFDTVGGLVIGALDRVPKEKDEVVISELKFVVEKMDGPRIERLRIFK